MNRLFKKTLSLMLVIVMTVSLGVSAAAAGQTGAAQAEGPLGIVSAMSVELNALVEATKISKTEEIAGNTFYEGVLNGVDVVLVKAGIGRCWRRPALRPSLIPTTWAASSLPALPAAWAMT